MNHAKLFTFKFLNVCYDRFSFCLYLYLSVLSSHKVMLSLLINVRWYRGAACLFQDNKKISFLPCFDISCFVMFFFFVFLLHTQTETQEATFKLCIIWIITEFCYLLEVGDERKVWCIANSEKPQISTVWAIQDTNINCLRTTCCS